MPKPTRTPERIALQNGVYLHKATKYSYYMTDGFRHFGTVPIENVTHFVEALSAKEKCTNCGSLQSALQSSAPELGITADADLMSYAPEIALHDAITRRQDAQSTAGEWRDISTAPKDGAHFWAIEAETNHHMEVWWAEEKGHAPGWMTHSDIPKCNGTDYAHFSHWMPLPPAPTGEG